MRTLIGVMSDIQPNSWLWSRFTRAFSQHDYQQAARLVAHDLDNFVHQVSALQAQAFLQGISDTPAPTDPHHLYCAGVLLLCAGEEQRAMTQLHGAYSHFKEQTAHTQMMAVALAIVYANVTAHELEAAYLLLQEHQPLFAQRLVTDLIIAGHFCLQMAELCWTRQQFALSRSYGEQAVALFIEGKWRRGQIAAALHMVLIRTHAGNHAEARSEWQAVSRWLARQPMLEGKLLYVELYLHLSQRQLIYALHLAHRYRKWADRTAKLVARLHARLILGNLYRELEEHVTATRWYSETLHLSTPPIQQAFQQYVDLECCWLDIVDGRLPDARRRIYTYSTNLPPMSNLPVALAMNFQTQLAIIHLLEGDLTGAEQLLQESLAFYRQNEDQMACCAVHVYLGYIALQQQNTRAILYHFHHSFGWMQEQGITSFARWWHPDLLAAICGQTLAADLYSELSEQILVSYLGSHGVDTLNRYLTNDDVEVRRRAYRLLHTIAGTASNMLAHLPESPGKRILTQLLNNGVLRAERYPLLEQELMTARYRHLPNATILAVFGLYVSGVRRTDIAAQLDCSLENVRNYITEIYVHFDVKPDSYSTRQARRQRLIEIARVRGFIE